jgi:hypothetical protein
MTTTAEQLTVDDAVWRSDSARWPVPHEWHDLDLLEPRTLDWVLRLRRLQDERRS